MKKKLNQKTIFKRTLIVALFSVIVITILNFGVLAAPEADIIVKSVENLVTNEYTVPIGTQLSDIDLPNELSIVFENQIEAEVIDGMSGNEPIVRTEFRTEDLFDTKAIEWIGTYNSKVPGTYILTSKFVTSNLIYNGEMPKVRITVQEDITSNDLEGIVENQKPAEGYSYGDVVVPNLESETDESENLVVKQEKGYQDGGYGEGQVSVEVGKSIEYEIKFTQPKENPAKVVITDIMSPGLNYTFNSAVFSGGEYTENFSEDAEGNTIIVWTIENLPEGNYTVQYDAEVIALDINYPSNGVPIQEVRNEANISFDDDSAIQLGTVENPVPQKYYEEDVRVPGVMFAKNAQSSLDSKSKSNILEQDYMISYENLTGEPQHVKIIDTTKILSGTGKFVYVENSARLKDGSQIDPISITNNPDGGQTIIWDLGEVPNKTKGLLVYTTELSGIAEYENDAIYIEGENEVQLRPLERKIVGKSYDDFTQPNEEKEVWEEIPYRIEFENVYQDPIEVLISDTMSIGLHYIERSAKLNDEYVSEEKIMKNADGTTTIIWYFENVPTGEYILTYSAEVGEEALIIGEIRNNAAISYENGPMLDLGELPNPVIPDDDENRLPPIIDPEKPESPEGSMPIDPEKPESPEILTPINPEKPEVVPPVVDSENSKNESSSISNSATGRPETISSNSTGSNEMNSGNNSNSNHYDPVKNPNTGDEYDLSFWVGIMAGSVAVIIAIIGISMAYKIKKNKK